MKILAILTAVAVVVSSSGDDPAEKLEVCWKSWKSCQANYLESTLLSDEGADDAERLPLTNEDDWPDDDGFSLSAVRMSTTPKTRKQVKKERAYSSPETSKQPSEKMRRRRTAEDSSKAKRRLGASATSANLDSVIRLNMGSDFEVSGVHVSFAAQAYLGLGSVFEVTTARSITNVPVGYPESVYKTLVQNDAAFTYQIPVGDAASVRVCLHFAEITNFRAGARIFDVTVESTVIASNLDIADVAGNYHAYVLDTGTADYIAVADGVVDITFTPVKDFAMVSGIELFFPEPPPIRINAGSNDALEGSGEALGVTFEGHQTCEEYVATDPPTSGPSVSPTKSPLTTAPTGTAEPTTYDSDAPTTSPSTCVEGQSSLATCAIFDGICCDPLEVCKGYLAYLSSGSPTAKQLLNPDLSEANLVGGIPEGYSGYPSALYETRVQGTNFSFSIPVPTGDRFDIAFHFCDDAMAGDRPFKILIDGDPVLTGLDVTAEAGGQFRAMVKVVRWFADPKKEEMEIRFVGEQETSDPYDIIGEAIVSAIEVVAVSADEPYRINMGSYQTVWPDASKDDESLVFGSAASWMVNLDPPDRVDDPRRHVWYRPLFDEHSVALDPNETIPEGVPRGVFDTVAHGYTFAYSIPVPWPSITLKVHFRRPEGDAYFLDATYLEVEADAVYSTRRTRFEKISDLRMSEFPDQKTHQWSGRMTVKDSGRCGKTVERTRFAQTCVVPTCHD